MKRYFTGQNSGPVAKAEAVATTLIMLHPTLEYVCQASWIFIHVLTAMPSGLFFSSRVGCSRGDAPAKVACASRPKASAATRFASAWATLPSINIEAGSAPNAMWPRSSFATPAPSTPRSAASIGGTARTWCRSSRRPPSRPGAPNATLRFPRCSGISAASWCGLCGCSFFRRPRLAASSTMCPSCSMRMRTEPLVSQRPGRHKAPASASSSGAARRRRSGRISLCRCVEAGASAVGMESA
mmetsp:Transcript_107952/g.302401  ORF Transcript_107952/g.302401 Transcript_107952/m.302401 type:complete len:241 (-) Transcript_107952:57-779(-)